MLWVPYCVEEPLEGKETWRKLQHGCRDVWVHDALMFNCKVDASAAVPLVFCESKVYCIEQILRTSAYLQSSREEESVNVIP